MGFTLWVNAGNDDRGPGRLVFRADDPTLTPYAGLAISGELLRKLRLAELIDAELAAVARVAPVKRRRRGLSPGELVLALAESQLVGGDCFDDVQDLRADAAGAPLRAVAATPSAADGAPACLPLQAQPHPRGRAGGGTGGQRARP